MRALRCVARISLPEQSCAADDSLEDSKMSRADFPDAHFDVVLSNQVLEHVRDPQAAIADMHRLLKPGGSLIVSFPVSDTWYEGHVGLYFAHRLPKRLYVARNLFQSRTKTWLRSLFTMNLHAGGMGQVFRANSRTMSVSIIRGRSYGMRSKKVFGAPVEDLSVDYVRARLGSRARSKNSGCRRSACSCAFVYHKRAGEILRVRKPWLKNKNGGLSAAVSIFKFGKTIPPRCALPARPRGHLRRRGFRTW